jgi:hypothetical protein
MRCNRLHKALYYSIFAFFCAIAEWFGWSNRDLVLHNLLNVWPSMDLKQKENPQRFRILMILRPFSSTKEKKVRKCPDSRSVVTNELYIALPRKDYYHQRKSLASGIESHLPMREVWRKKAMLHGERTRSTHCTGFAYNKLRIDSQRPH